MMILLACIIIPTTLISGALMEGTLLLVVLITSLCVFGARDNLGEAILSIVGGIITVLRVDWTPSLYIAFLAC